MPFKTPLNSALTESQNKALSKLNSLKTYVSAPKLSFPELTEEQQISTFDLSKKFISAIAGEKAVDDVLKRFLLKIFATSGEDEFLLEDIIVGGIADALDAKGIQLAPKRKTQDVGLTGSTTGSTTGTTTGTTQTVTEEPQKQFTQFESVEYLFTTITSAPTPNLEITGDTNSTENQVLNVGSNENDIIIKLETNNEEKLPNSQITYPAGTTSLTIEELLLDVQYKADNIGFFIDGVNYPKTGTPLSEVPFLVGNIVGKVYDTNFVTIPGAKIEILGSNPKIQLLSDVNGEYKINGLKRGKYNLSASYSTYSSNTVSDFEVLYDNDNSLNFQLELDASTLTAQTQSTDQTSIEYQYTVVERPVNYSYSSIENEQEDLVVILVQNDISLPEFSQEYALSNFNNDSNLAINNLTQEVEQNGYFISGTTYPKPSTNIVIEVNNNVNLSPFSETISNYTETPEVEINNFINQVNTNGYNSGGLQYPPQGTAYSNVTNSLNPSGNTTNEQLFEPLPPISALTGETGDVSTGSISPSIEEQLFSLLPENPEITPFQFNESGELDINQITSAGYNPDDIGLTNRQYLDKYLKPALSAGKRVLVAQIIKMIFGPKEIMSNDEQTQELLLNSAACGEKMFSVTNNPSITEKELEFNRIELKKQLENGRIELTVSCQKVEIKLPENFEEEFDLLPSEDVGIPESQRPNPANSFILLENFVQSEVQRQRNEEDANEVRKSFFEILIDKIMQYISVAFTVSPEIGQVFNLLNAEIQKANKLKGENEKYDEVTPDSLCSSPCKITDACKKSESSGNPQDKKEFDEKSAFSRSIINSLYSLVLSMLIRKLLTEAKAQIRKLVQERAKEKVLKLIKQQQNKFKFLSQISNAASAVSEAATKAAKYKSAFESSGIQGIVNYRKNKKENGSNNNNQQ